LDGLSYDSRTVGGPVRIPLQRFDGMFRLPLYKKPAFPQALRFPDSRPHSFLTVDNDGNEFANPIAHESIDADFLHVNSSDLLLHSLSIHGRSFLSGDLDYAMVRKSEVTEKFKLYNSTLAHYGFRVQNLHSDRGSEYFANLSNDKTVAALDRFCAGCIRSVTAVESHEFVENRQYMVINNCYFYEGMGHRIDALRSFDKRRSLMKLGLPRPLQIDDWDNEGGDSVRNLYADPEGLRFCTAPYIRFLRLLRFRGSKFRRLLSLILRFCCNHTIVLLFVCPCHRRICPSHLG
jgi:hypothetical protein